MLQCNYLTISAEASPRRHGNPTAARGKPARTPERRAGDGREAPIDIAERRQRAAALQCGAAADVHGVRRGHTAEQITGAERPSTGQRGGSRDAGSLQRKVPAKCAKPGIDTSQGCETAVCR